MKQETLKKLEQAYLLLQEAEEEIKADVEEEIRKDIENNQIALAKMSRLSFVQSTLILLKRSALGLGSDVLGYWRF